MEEANAFAHRVTVLLEKYRLEEADIDFSNVGGQPAISQQEVGWGDYGLSPARRRCAWMEGLAIAVGMNNGTAILCLQGTNVLTLVGKHYLQGYRKALATRFCSRGGASVSAASGNPRAFPFHGPHALEE